MYSLFLISFDFSWVDIWTRCSFFKCYVCYKPLCSLSRFQEYNFLQTYRQYLLFRSWFWLLVIAAFCFLILPARSSKAALNSDRGVDDIAFSFLATRPPGTSREEALLRLWRICDFILRNLLFVPMSNAFNMHKDHFVKFPFWVSRSGHMNSLLVPVIITGLWLWLQIPVPVLYRHSDKCWCQSCTASWS